MGIGFDFGPPKAEGFDPINGDWLGDRKLSTEELSELVRLVESWGYALSGHDDEYLIDVPCEEFMFNASGGYLSKPGAGSERDRDDEFDEQLGLAERLCDYAGWVMVGDGYGYGFEETDAGYVFHTSPPERAAPAADSLLDEVRSASTAGALKQALATLRDTGTKLPMNDEDVLFALLVSHDEDVVSDAISRLAALPELASTPLRMGRLRRVVTLSDDPELVERVKALSERLT